MYVLLTGSKKNAGDFLIAHAAKRLFREYAPNPEYIELAGWRGLDEHLDSVNSAKALILCGGPAYQPSLGDTIYPLTKNLDSITVPIVSFGLGFKAAPGDDYDVEHAYFRPCAKPLLDRIRSDFKYAGCRDYLTYQVLRRHGFDNALMTGCPAWYDPDYFGKSPVIGSTISRVVFTPAEQPIFRGQTVAVMRAVRDLFDGAQLVCSFHRGWRADRYTKSVNAENAAYLETEARRIGFETWDVSGSVDGISKYEQFDLHVGYRVHAHLKMLSMRKPSFLVAEDSRGRGVLEAMELKGVNGWRHDLPARYIPHPLLRRIMRKTAGAAWINKDASGQLKEIVSEEIKSNFQGFQGAIETIDATWKQMYTMLSELPS